MKFWLDVAKLSQTTNSLNLTRKQMYSALRNAKKFIQAFGSWLIGAITDWLQATDPEVGPGLWSAPCLMVVTYCFSKTKHTVQDHSYSLEHEHMDIQNWRPRQHKQVPAPQIGPGSKEHEHPNHTPSHIIHLANFVNSWCAIYFDLIASRDRCIIVAEWV